MDEIVVARPDRSMIVIGAIATAIILLSATQIGRWEALVIVLVLAAAAVYRFTQMKLAVTPSSVVVVNFTSRHELPLDEVRIVDEKDKPVWLSDSGGKLDTSGRALYLVEDSGRKVHVGLAPVYGSRLDAIAEDLYRAIATMQARG